MTERVPDSLVPRTATYFANIYPPLIGSCGHVYNSRETADQMAGRDRIMCVEFTVDLDQGDSDADANSESGHEA